MVLAWGDLILPGVLGRPRPFDRPVYLAAADPNTAAAHARQALSVFGPIGAPQRFVAQRVLAATGDRTAARDPLDVLTPREREILRFVAQGLSNPQIAARLVIAPKTAEHHVSAILRKLHLRSRSEAAVYAATLREPTGRTEVAPAP